MQSWYIILILLGSIAIPAIFVVLVRQFYRFLQHSKTEHKPNSSSHYKKKIEVNLNDCSVIKSNYFRNVEYPEGRFTILDPGNFSSKIDQEEIECTFVAYNYLNRKFVSHPIYKNEITVKYLLSKREITYIYINSENEEEYFFDLNFLNDES